MFDGVFVQVAGARTGEFNFRGAQPSVQYVHGPAFEPPFTYVPTSETPATILDEQRRRGGVPYIFEVNTANEYWRSDGFLVHADPLGEGDLVGEAGTRTYMMAGCQHGAGMPVLIHRSPLSPEQRVGNLMGTLAYLNLTRAALVNLAEWAEQGNAPPPQTTPTLTAETAKPRAAVLEQIRRIPGAYTIAPETLTELKRQTDGRSHPAFVSAVDVDGNEVAGIRLPEIQVPVSTYAGWNVRHEENGGIGQMSDMVGSTIPFPRTVAERLASGDPRLSIEERYRDRDHYVQLVRTAAEGLVRERFILVEDLERAVANAARLYDRVMEQ